MTTKKTKTKQYKVFTPVGAIGIRLIETKTKAKRFCLTILLFVVLLSDICFIVRYMFFLYGICPPHSNEDQTN